MKTKDLIRGYFDNALGAEEARSGLAAAGAKRFLQMIEMDQYGKEILSDFAPAEGAAQRLADFVADQDPSVLIVPEAKGRLHSHRAGLVPEVVGFQKKSRRKAKKSHRSTKRKKK